VQGLMRCWVRQGAGLDRNNGLAQDQRPAWEHRGDAECNRLGGLLGNKGLDRIKKDVPQGQRNKRNLTLQHRL
jgi:hypothetical protein